MRPQRKLSQPGVTPEPSKNDGMTISNIPNDTTNQHCHHLDVAHAAEVKYENNRYINPVNVDFDSTKSDSTVNIASKNYKLFTIINLLDLSVKIITDDDTIIHHPKSSPREQITQQNSKTSTIEKSAIHIFSSAKPSTPPEQYHPWNTVTIPSLPPSRKKNKTRLL